MALVGLEGGLEGMRCDSALYTWAGRSAVQSRATSQNLMWTSLGCMSVWILTLRKRCWGAFGDLDDEITSMSARRGDIRRSSVFWRFKPDLQRYLQAPIVSFPLGWLGLGLRAALTVLLLRSYPAVPSEPFAVQPVVLTIRLTCTSHPVCECRTILL